MLFHFAAGDEALHRDVRIVGGKEITDTKKYPWLVSLLWKFPVSRYHKPTTYRYGTCGAAIIDRQWLLSAAHCFAK